LDGNPADDPAAEDIDPLLPNLHPTSTKETLKLDKEQLLARTKENHRSKHEDQAFNALYLHLSEISDPEVKKLFESCSCILIDANFPIQLNKPDVQSEKMSKTVGETTKTKKRHRSDGNSEAPGNQKSEKKKKKKRQSE